MRHRLGSPKAVTVYTIYLSLLGLLALLALPPELGRLDDLGQDGLLRAILVVQTVLVGYFTSACACGEIVIEGEKSAWDLAASPFPAAVIGWGKVAASAVFAILLVALGTPLLSVIAGIRGASFILVARAALTAAPFAAALGSVGALYGATFDSDFARSFVHWLTLVAWVVAATALPAPWDAISPVRAVALAASGGVRSAGAAAAGYALVAVVSGWAIARRVEAIRREARAT